MQERRTPLTARQTLLLILLPMLATFAGLRLYLHLVHVRHVYPGGYLIHHLFIGVLILIPASFLMAFSPRHRVLQVLAPATVGIGSAMTLDEFTYLVATQGSDADYVSHVSLIGAMVCIVLAVILLLILYVLHHD
jgi:hypothetical protein